MGVHGFSVDGSKNRGRRRGEITDRIRIRVDVAPDLRAATDALRDYIAEETLAIGIELASGFTGEDVAITIDGYSVRFCNRTSVRTSPALSGRPERITNLVDRRHHRGPAFRRRRGLEDSRSAESDAAASRPIRGRLWGQPLVLGSKPSPQLCEVSLIEAIQEGPLFMRVRVRQNSNNTIPPTDHRRRRQRTIKLHDFAQVLLGDSTEGNDQRRLGRLERWQQIAACALAGSLPNTIFSIRFASHDFGQSVVKPRNDRTLEQFDRSLPNRRPEMVCLRVATVGE